VVNISNKNKLKIKAGTPVRIGLVIGIVLAMLALSFSIPTPRLVQDQIGHEKSWHIIWAGSFADLVKAEATPGAGVAGILEVFFANHTATPNQTYSVNASSTIETWCTAAHLGYASADDFYTELAHTTSFDVVVRVRGNTTICGDGSVYRAEWLRVNITAAAPLSMTDQWTFRVNTSNTSTEPFIWCNFYINGTYISGSDFQLAKDQSCAITEIRFDAYY